MKKPAVLLVDDEPNIVHALKRSLSEEGYEVYTAVGGEAALEVLQQRKVDLVISDQFMPGMTGAELLKIVRLNYPGTARLILTGNAHPDMAAEAANEVGVECMLLKPWDEMELRLSIKRSLQQRGQNK